MEIKKCTTLGDHAHSENLSVGFSSLPFRYECQLSSEATQLINIENRLDELEKSIEKLKYV